MLVQTKNVTHDLSAQIIYKHTDPMQTKTSANKDII